MWHYPKEDGIKYNLWKVWHKLTSPFRQTYYWMVKSIQYSIFLWKNDYDFDYVSILRMLQYKIGRVRRTIYKNNIIEGAELYARQMIIAEAMIDELIQDDFAADLHEAHDKKWGKINFGNNPDPKGGALWRENVKTTQDKIQQGQEISHIINEEERLRTEAYQRTFAYIAKYIRYWWD